MYFINYNNLNNKIEFIIMFRNLFNTSKYENRVLMYHRRSNLGNIYKSDEYVLKATNIKGRNYKHEFNMLNILKHPNIIPIKDSFYEGDKFYSVLPYYKKGDLLTNIFEKNEWTQFELALAISKIIKPIAYIHKYGIVHLDIKLENYLESHRGEYILIDFENARWYRRENYYSLGKLMHVTGTNEYMAPEIKYLKYGPTSDMYSLGKILYLVIANQQSDISNIDWGPIREKLPDLQIYIHDMLNENPLLRPTIFDLSNKVKDLTIELLIK